MQNQHVTLLTILAVSLFICGCPSYKTVQCIEDSNCDLYPGGVCITAIETGHKWCAHPDSSCPSGLRYDKDGKYPETGDGLSGVCVVQSDAGRSDAAVSVPPASCSVIPYACGINGNDSCCSSPPVSGGTYFRSYDVAGDSASGAKDAPASISSFRLDKYEVTVGRFREFVAANRGTGAHPPVAGTGAHPKLPGSGWQDGWNASLVTDTAAIVAAVKCDATYQTWTDTPGLNETRPINCVTWYEAMAFCIWDGGYLPTEAEWNYAATGGEQQRAYPWSNPPGLASIDGTYASYACLGDGNQGCASIDLQSVGTKPKGDGRWGQSDLAGNVAEWTLDESATYVSPCEDCANLAPAMDRTARGGDFFYGPDRLRTASRDYPTPTQRNAFTGARCARAP